MNVNDEDNIAMLHHLKRLILGLYNPIEMWVLKLYTCTHTYMISISIILHRHTCKIIKDLEKAVNDHKMFKDEASRYS